MSNNHYTLRWKVQGVNSILMKKKLAFFETQTLKNLSSINGGETIETEAQLAREKTAGGSVCINTNSGSGTYTWSWTSDIKHSNGSITYKGSTAP